MKLGFALAAVALAAACGGTGADGNGPSCGDGVQQAGEQCDDGTSNGVPGDPCSATCTTLDTGCGDGVLESGEACDDGSRNGPAPAECSATCTFNEPTLTVDWQITDLDGTSGPCPGWPAHATDPEPSPSTIRLLNLAPDGSTVCAGPDYVACTIATFDCVDGTGSVRLPAGKYSLALQPVQSTDVYAATQPVALDFTSSQDLPFGSNGGIHQGTKLSVSWTAPPDATTGCQSLQVLATSVDDLGHVTTWPAKTEPCSAGTDVLGPYLPGTYTVGISEQPSGNVTPLMQPVVIDRSNQEPIMVQQIVL